MDVPEEGFKGICLCEKVGEGAAVSSQVPKGPFQFIMTCQAFEGEVNDYLVLSPHAS